MHRAQLRSLGLTDRAIGHRVARGELHPKWPGVYAVGRARLSKQGEWWGAILTCGTGAVLSHASAAALWRMRSADGPGIDVSIPSGRRCRREGITVHRRQRLRPKEVTARRGIAVTTPVLTVIDLATVTPDRAPLEEAINRAIRLGLTSVAELKAAQRAYRYQPGVRVLAKLLEGFHLTQSHLERLFIPLAAEAGLPPPLTQARVNGYDVDFYWPDLGLVVECDGGAFHRSASQQTRDRRRDHAHYMAGLMPLRFTHAQVAYERGYVKRVLEEARFHPLVISRRHSVGK